MQPRVFAPDNAQTVGAASWGEVVEGFLNAFDFAPATCRAYRADLRSFAEYFARVNRQPVRLEGITPPDVRGFRDALRDAGKATSTVNRSVQTVRKLIAHAVSDELLPPDRLATVQSLHIVPQGAKGITTADARRLLRECAIRNDKRAAAVFSLLLHTGLRVSELAALTNDDVRIGERSGWIVVRKGKGRKERTVAMPQAARRALITYRMCRSVVGWHRLFRGQRGILTADGIRHLCSLYADRLSLDFSPHTLRHTFAHAYLAANPGDIVGLADVLGHSRIETTRIYTRPTAADALDRSERVSY